MKFKNSEMQTSYFVWKKSNKDNLYAEEIFEYAENFADAIEKILNINPKIKIKDFALELSYKINEADCTAFMVACAVKILSLVWAHGEELRLWFNSEYNYSGKGVVHNSLVVLEDNEDFTPEGEETFTKELLLELGEYILPFMEHKYE